MIDVYIAKNSKLLSNMELNEYKKYLEQKIKEYKNKLQAVNRVIKSRGNNCTEVTNATKK